MWDLNYIKANVNLLDYVLCTKPLCNQKRTGNTITINPCPICGHNGDFMLYPETNTFCCFHGDTIGGSIIDFIMLTESLSLGEAVKKSAELAGLTAGERRSFNSYDNNPKPVIYNFEDNYDYKKYDFTELINIAHQNSSKTNYYKARGLTDKTINKYKLGYHTDGFNFALKNTEHEIGKENNILKFYRYFLPVLDENNICRYFITRLDDKNLPERLRTIIKEKTHNPKGLKVQLFNQRYITNPALANEIIFVVEGIFDALSLEEYGLSAIALNSTSNVSTLLKLIKSNIENLSNSSFVIIGDNDDAGKNMIKKLLSEIYRLKINVENCLLPHKYKDCNEFLVSDKSGFEEFFSKYVNPKINDSKTA